MYDYKNELKHLSSENPDGLHKALLTVSLRAMRLCADAGTVRMDKLMTAAFEGGVSDNWGQLAVITTSAIGGGSARGPWMGRRVAKLYSRGVMGPHAGG